MRLEIKAGTSKELKFELKDINNNAIDITGLVGTLKIYLNVPGTNSSPVISKTVTITNALNGLCTAVVLDSETLITPAIYNYTLTFEYTTGDNRVLDSGTVNIIGDDIDRINQIKQRYGLGFDYYTMKTALDYARTQIKGNTIKHEKGSGMITDKNNSLELCNYVMDANGDGSVDASDITIYEYLKVFPFTVNNLQSNISSLILETPIGKSYIVMDAKYPSEGFTLGLEYYRGVKPYVDALPIIDKAEEYYVLYRLFTTMEINKLQRGITNRGINGVDIVFDKDSIDSFLQILRNWIATENLRLIPFNSCLNNSGSSVTKSVLINKGY